MIHFVQVKPSNQVEILSISFFMFIQCEIFLSVHTEYTHDTYWKFYSCKWGKFSGTAVSSHNPRAILLLEGSKLPLGVSERV